MHIVLFIYTTRPNKDQSKRLWKDANDNGQTLAGESYYWEAICMTAEFWSFPYLRKAVARKFLRLHQPQFQAS